MGGALTLMAVQQEVPGSETKQTRCSCWLQTTVRFEDQRTTGTGGNERLAGLLACFLLTGQAPRRNEKLSNRVRPITTLRLFLHSLSLFFLLWIWNKFKSAPLETNHLTLTHYPLSIAPSHSWRAWFEMSERPF